MNNAAMNIHVHICLRGESLHFTLIPRHGTARSYGNSILKFLRHFNTVQGGCTILHSHEQWMRVRDDFGSLICKLLSYRTCAQIHCCVTLSVLGTKNASGPVFVRILSVSEGPCVDQISHKAAAQGRSSGRVGGLPLLVLSRKNIGNKDI